ncbi:MAG: type II toxin-antitoxin system Phd/YefM family antitoxin [Proteobacteria bacterium]|nr:type II toxin-antitoxin system Phd/YefM family antitoxin [Pseudomonadota bacterium]
MEIYTTSQARDNLIEIVDHVAQSHEPTYIVGEKGKAVLISESDYRAMLETLHLTSIPGIKDSIIKASREPLEDFSESIDWDNV